MGGGSRGRRPQHRPPARASPSLSASRPRSAGSCRRGPSWRSTRRGAAAGVRPAEASGERKAFSRGPASRTLEVRGRRPGAQRQAPAAQAPRRVGDAARRRPDWAATSWAAGANGGEGQSQTGRRGRAERRARRRPVRAGPRSGNPAVRAGARQPAGRPKGSRRTAAGNLGRAGRRGDTAASAATGRDALHPGGRPHPAPDRARERAAGRVPAPAAAAHAHRDSGRPARAGRPAARRLRRHRDRPRPCCSSRWLSYLSWPAVTTSAKATRLAIIALLVGFAVSRFFV